MHFTNGYSFVFLVCGWVSMAELREEDLVDYDFDEPASVASTVSADIQAEPSTGSLGGVDVAWTWLHLLRQTDRLPRVLGWRIYRCRVCRK